MIISLQLHIRVTTGARGEGVSAGSLPSRQNCLLQQGPVRSTLRGRDSIPPRVYMCVC